MLTNRSRESAFSYYSHNKFAINYKPRPRPTISQEVVWVPDAKNNSSKKTSSDDHLSEYKKELKLNL